jgi:hypothetical protein
MSASLRRKSVESREHGVAFARAVFNGADKNGDGTLTKTEVRKYFKANPEDKVRVCHFHPTPEWYAPTQHPIPDRCGMLYATCGA